MPILIVKPIDMAAPGSYAARRLIRRTLSEVRAAAGRIEQLQAQTKALQEAADGGNAEAVAGADNFWSEIAALSGRVMDAMNSLEDLVIKQARTDDGSPVEVVLDVISADDFDVLLRAMLGESPVPTKSSGS